MMMMIRLQNPIIPYYTLFAFLEAVDQNSFFVIFSKILDYCSNLLQ